MTDLTESGRLLLEVERKKAEAMAFEREMRADTPSDPKKEVPRLLNQLDRAADRLSDNLQQLLMRTAVVAAVDRSLPDEADNTPTEEAQTELGSALQNLLYRLDHLSDQINDRNYQLEI